MLKSREDLRSLREIYINSSKKEDKKILVCAGTGCVAGGSLDIYQRFIDIMKEKGINCSVELQKEPHDNSIGVKRSGCHGFCEMGPLVRIEPQGYLYTKVKVDDCMEIIEKTIENDEIVERLA